MIRNSILSLISSRNERAGFRLRNVSRRCSLAIGERLRPGKSRGVLVCYATASRASLAIGSDVLDAFHLDFRVFRCTLGEERVQVGRLRRRREVGVANGQEIPAGRESTWLRFHWEIHARRQHAQQPRRSQGEPRIKVTNRYIIIIWKSTRSTSIFFSDLKNDFPKGSWDFRENDHWSTVGYSSLVYCLRGMLLF